MSPIGPAVRTRSCIVTCSLKPDPTLEVPCDAVICVYADVVGTVRAGKVLFELNGQDLVCTRKAH
jgi:hypothetical protein